MNDLSKRELPVIPQADEGGPELPDADGLPELSDDLPPVQPPSAGFILQLFVVPGLIVLAVVAVWALFGRIAIGEQDWRSLLTELQSPNPNISRRAMYGLAQVLDRDRRLGEAGQHLSTNSTIAKGISELLLKEIRSDSKSEESLKFQIYLARATGMMDSFDDTSVALIEALDHQRDFEVRKSAMASIALVAGRALEKNQPVDSPPLVEALIRQSRDSEPLMQQTAAFSLGLFPSTPATEQLEQLLDSADEKTRINAAIALSRSKSLRGLPVFLKALSAPVPATPDLVNEQVIILRNVLRAVGNLAPHLNSEDKAEARQRIQSLIDRHPEARIRVDAQQTLLTLTPPK